jgi:heme-degrading monooxygenase HmoA
MAVAHIVMFKVRKGVRQAQINNMLHALEEWRETVPGIVEIRATRNLAKVRTGFNYGLIIRFKDKAAWQEFAQGDLEEVRDVVEDFVEPIVEDVVVGDFEI